jgi:hypothetical protein
MRTNISFRRQAKLLAATALVVNALAVAATPAEAGNTIDMRAAQVNGQPIGGANTAKNVVVLPGDTVTLELFSIVTGTNAANDELTKGGSGNIVSSSGGLLGNLVASPTSTGGGLYNFRANGFQNGAVQDLDGDGDLDVGTPMNNQNVTQFFNARSSGGVELPGGELIIGRATFTVSAGGFGETLINFVPRTEEDGSPATEGAVWFQDGGFDQDGFVQATNPFNPTVAGASYLAGPPVRVAVPEPAGLTAAALTSIGLTARRRRGQGERDRARRARFLTS